MKKMFHRWDLESKNGEKTSRTYQLLVKRAELALMHHLMDAVLEQSSQSTSSSSSAIKRVFNSGCDHSPPLTPTPKRILLNSGPLIMPSNWKFQGKKKVNLKRIVLALSLIY